MNLYLNIYQAISLNDFLDKCISKKESNNDLIDARVYEVKHNLDKLLYNG